MVNTCKEFHILPLNKGDPSIRDFALLKGRINPLWRGGFFHYKFDIEINGKHHLNPLWRGKMTIFICFLMVRINPLRRGQIMFITITLHPTSATHPHHPLRRGKVIFITDYWLLIVLYNHRWSFCPSIRDWDDVFRWFWYNICNEKICPSVRE